MDFPLREWPPRPSRCSHPSRWYLANMIVAPENKYSLQDDVKAGREASQEVAKQLPMLRDDGVDSYVER